MKPLPPLDRPVNTRHQFDPDNYRRDGSARKPAGRFLRKAGRAVFTVAKGAALGIIDGTPGLSQLQSGLTQRKVIQDANTVSRVLFGWATVVMYLSILLMKVYGQVDTHTMLTVLRLLFGM